MNPDKATSYRRKLVSSARAIITYEVGLPLGCARTSRILFWLRPFQADEFPVFDEYLQATRELPTGQERLQCDRDYLRKVDVQLEATNRAFRDRVFDACYTILDRFETPDAESIQST